MMSRSRTRLLSKKSSKKRGTRRAAKRDGICSSIFHFALFKTSLLLMILSAILMSGNFEFSPIGVEGKKQHQKSSSSSSFEAFQNERREKREERRKLETLAARQNEEEEEERFSATTRKKMVGLSEEEQNSMQIPSHMRCDACHAISHKLTTNIRKTERKHGKGKNVQKRLRVDQYEQSFEDTCKDEQFWGEYYGVTHGKDGHNYFNGPGLTVLPKTLHKAQTLSMETTLRKGGMWSHRMREFCEQMVYSSEEDLDESDMYSILYESTPNEEESRGSDSGSDSSDSSSSSNPPPPQRIIINKDTRTFREKMCARTCKKFPTRRPTTTEEELESGWEPFDEDAFTEKKRAQRKEDEAYRQAHKLVEDLTSGRGDGGEL